MTTIIKIDFNDINHEFSEDLSEMFRNFVHTAIAEKLFPAVNSSEFDIEDIKVDIEVKVNVEDFGDDVNEAESRHFFEGE